MFVIICQLRFVLSTGGGAIALDDFRGTIGQCSYRQTCDFETGMCDWTQSSTNGNTWNLVQYSNSFNSSGYQIGDRTTKTDQGHIIETNSNAPVNSVAYLTSMPFARSAGVQCLQFWYIRKSPNTVQDLIEVYLGHGSEGTNPVISLFIL